MKEPSSTPAAVETMAIFRPSAEALLLAVLPEAAAALLAPAAAELELEPPQAARPRAMVAVSRTAISFFMRFIGRSFLSFKFSS